MKHNFKVTIPLAIVITLLAVIYQRTTGPTYPKKITVGVEESNQVVVKFPRSQGGTEGALVEIPKIEKEMSGSITYKRYPTDDPWTTLALKDEANRLTAILPSQPPAGKLTYFLNLSIKGKEQKIASEKEPIFIRFKGDVPTFILAPHIFFMFLSMLFSAWAFFEAIFNTESFVKIGRVTLGCLAFGGMVLGPIVQKYAFGVYWAGFPYDYDLTDNKLLIGVIAWLIGVLFTLKEKKRWPVVFAAVVLIAVYSIPHSMGGSEYDYKKGQVITTDKALK
jgi:hypothetical protein